MKELGRITYQTVGAGLVTAVLYRAEVRRRGRRIRLLSAGGRVVYDTDDCYDAANAQTALGAWLEVHPDFHESQPPPAGQTA